MKRNLLIIGLSVAMCVLIFLLGRFTGKATATLNMANTVDPIITQISEEVCGYENVQYTSPAKGGSLIYKREYIETCISGAGNTYYIRCYDWWRDKEDMLWRKPTKDIKIGSYSCIAEKDIVIPYFDKGLQKAGIGQYIKYGK